MTSQIRKNKLLRPVTALAMMVFATVSGTAVHSASLAQPQDPIEQEPRERVSVGFTGFLLEPDAQPFIGEFLVLVQQDPGGNPQSVTHSIGESASDGSYTFSARLAPSTLGSVRLVFWPLDGRDELEVLHFAQNRESSLWIDVDSGRSVEVLLPQVDFGPAQPSVAVGSKSLETPLLIQTAYVYDVDGGALPTDSSLHYAPFSFSSVIVCGPNADLDAENHWTELPATYALGGLLELYSFDVSADWELWFTSLSDPKYSSRRRVVSKPLLVPIPLGEFSGLSVQIGAGLLLQGAKYVVIEGKVRRNAKPVWPWVGNRQHSGGSIPSSPWARIDSTGSVVFGPLYEGQYTLSVLPADMGAALHSEDITLSPTTSHAILLDIL